MPSNHPQNSPFGWLVLGVWGGAAIGDFVAIAFDLDTTHDRAGTLPPTLLAAWILGALSGALVGWALDSLLNRRPGVTLGAACLALPAGYWILLRLPHLFSQKPLGLCFPVQDRPIVSEQLAMGAMTVRVCALLALWVLACVFVASAGRSQERDVDRRTMKRPPLQFRIWHLVFATFLVAIVCAVSRQAGIHPLLVLVGMLYASGPWTALLAGAVVRVYDPRLERRAVGFALSGLVTVGVLLSMTNDLVDPGHLVTLTCGLWSPQILLYFLLRPLLSQDYGEDVNASHLTK